MDESSLSVGLFRSLALSALVILGYAYVIQATRGPLLSNAGVGLLFSAAGLVSMNDPVVLAPGVFYDGRIPLVALAYSFSGFIGVTLTTLIIGGYRLWIGGAGATSGVIGILIAATAGIVVAKIPNRFFLERRNKSLLIGVATSLSMVSTLALPAHVWAMLHYHMLLMVMIANIIGVLVLQNFLSNEKKRLRLIRTLEHDAAIDPLTKLVNRRAFDDQVKQALTVGHNPGGDYAVIMIDIDHFKSVNDTWGHDAGDSVLAGVAAIVSDSVRKTDIVARFGGEEIAVLLPGVTTQEAVGVAEKIRQRIEVKEFPAQASSMKVTISAGTAGANISRQDVPSALKAADSALYTAKRSGRNKVEAAAA